MPSESEVDPEEVARHRQWLAENEERMKTKSDEYAAGRAHLANDQRECVQELKADGNEAFKKGSTAMALDLYSQAIQMDRQCGNDDKVTAVLYLNRAACYLKQAEVGHDEAWADAERDCRRSLERSPTVKAYVRCARALSEGLQRPNDALACLAEALLLEPASSFVRQAITSLKAEQPPDAPALVVPETVLVRARRRLGQREERGQDKDAAVYSEVLALLDPPQIREHESSV